LASIKYPFYVHGFWTEQSGSSVYDYNLALLNAKDLTGTMY